ncbi:MAG: polysaccharide deacetylase family protein [Saprospiraceae bacterium]|nr:polysaccharide deacetylase family protein [Saprospiraceae bacterium]
MLITYSYAQQSGRFLWPEGYKAGLSLSFDDARLSDVDVGLDFFREHGVKVTYYVVPAGVEKRLSKWRQAVSDGHEIGNHTLVHPCSGNFAWSKNKALENYTLVSMHRELEQANEQIKELLDVDPVSFAYSCGQTFVGRGSETKSYVPLIAEMFESGRGWLNEASNDPLFADFAQLQGIEMDGKDFEEDIKPIIDAALTSGSWVVLAGHEIGEGGNQTTRTSMLRDLINYVKEAHPEIWLAPVGDIAHYVKTERKRLNIKLADDLLFYSSFDQGTDADLHKGEGKIFTAETYDPTGEGDSGLSASGIELLNSGGRLGGALQFERKTKESIYYLAKDNINYNASSISGTISFWLSLDPEMDLEPGFCDPIQITDSGYNDGAYWVDFSDKNPRLFRMGVFGDLQQWNPEKIAPDKNPAFNNRLVVAKNRPFGKGVWTHVSIVYEDINGSNPRAAFYVNGQLQDSREITEHFTWEVSKARIYLGLNLIGKMDERAIFGRALSASEIGQLYEMPEMLASSIKEH